MIYLICISPLYLNNTYLSYSINKLSVPNTYMVNHFTLANLLRRSFLCLKNDDSTLRSLLYRDPYFFILLFFYQVTYHSIHE